MSLLDDNTVKRIYDHIPEEQSKKLFVNRLIYSLTYDRSFIQKVVMDTAEGKKIKELVERFPKCILFGSGVWGGNILWVYPELNWVCAWDNNPKKDTLQSNNRGFGREQISLPVLKYDPHGTIDADTAIIISSRLYHDEIYHQLVSDGFPETQILDAGGLIDKMSKRQYFDLPYLKKEDREVFVDAGSFDGETSISFHKFYNGKYEKIIAFEPDHSNIEKWRNNIQSSGCHDIELRPYGLWDEADQLSFDSLSNGSSMVSESGSVVINVDRMDDLIEKDQRISFIKMDLEGAEYKAIKGAERIIKQNHPKLAISLYHKPEDVWVLPGLILSIDNNYRFYLRHYSIAASETVLYAI